MIQKKTPATDYEGNGLGIRSGYESRGKDNTISAEMQENNQVFAEPIKGMHTTEGGYLEIKTASQWIEEAKSIEIPNKLFGELWFESEMVILFASTGVGKTLLANQIADSITKGARVFDFFDIAPPQSILYCDFELSCKQFESRYSLNYTNHYIFSPNFYRAEINTDNTPPDNVKIEDYVLTEIERNLISTGARVLIVDNITFFRDEQEKAKDALRLMKQLRALKKRLNLSILILAHTPKRDNTKPITINDIAGSSQIANYTDSAFTIGESVNGKTIRYIKQNKPGRFSSLIYDANNVIVCQITNPFNFTRFDFIEFGKEIDHLKQRAKQEERNGAIIELFKKGNSLREIAEAVGISHTRVNSIIKKHSEENK